MKNILGKILLIFFSMSLPLFASQLAEFSFSLSKKNPFEKEAVEIIFKAHQKDKTDVMFFFLKPKKSPNYKIVLLQKEAQELAYHEKETEFRYLLFPLKSGKVKVEFDFVIKVASDKAVAQVYEGSRDNVKWIETDNTEIQLKPLELDVKKLKKDVALVGDFKLSSKIDKTSLKAYESVNIKYNLQGIGFDEFSITPIDNIKDVAIFSDVIKHYNKATKDGYKIQREFSYALISAKSFTIPSKEILCFSPKKQKYYTLKTKSYTIDIKTIPQSQLIDKREYPQSTDYSQSFKTFLIYLFIFIAGYISAKIELPSKKRKKQPFSDIQASKNPKELLYILMHSYTQSGLEEFYTELENMVYGEKSKAGFTKIKERILKRLQS
jgi:hypothetical protein